MEARATMELSRSNMVELVCLIKDIILDGLLKRPSPRDFWAQLINREADHIRD